MILKKRYILILSILLVILSLSCVGAADNSTKIAKEQNDDLISIGKMDNNNVSVSKENKSMSMASENKSSDLNETNNNLLAIQENNEVLSFPLSDNVLTNSIAISSSPYLEPTLQERTFKIGGYKVVLSKAQYKKLYKISGVEDYFFEDDYNYYYVGEKYKGYYITNSGLRTYVIVKTNKYVKVKLKIGKKTRYKKSRVYMMFTYGQGQSGVAYKHMAFLIHYYGYFNRYYESVKVLGKNAKYFGKCKCSSSFIKLNKSKLYGESSIYKKFSVW